MGTPAPTGLSALDAPDSVDYTRLLRWVAACAKGECKYLHPAGKPDSYRGAMGCPGYTGSQYLEDGVLVLRYRLCDRHQAWVRDQAHRIRMNRADTPSKRAGKSWTEDA